METRCFKAKIKPNALEELRAWFKTLNERSNEVLEALKKQGVYFESAFLDCVGDDYYLIFYIQAVDVKEAFKVFQNSKLPVAAFFKDQWGKTCEESIILEPLMNLGVGKEN